MRDHPIRIGPFELLHPLGSGGMGEVWAASHVVSQVEVAVKVIATAAAGSERLRRAFRTEVRAAASLDHPAVVTLLDAGEVPAEAAEASEGRLVAGSPYFVTERLTGGSLVEWVRDPRPWPEVLELVLVLLDGLAHAHARGVTHRDVKPGNVLLDARGRPRLTDFGIAHLHGADGDPVPSGTPPYLAPEQLLGLRGAIGPWTDLYALGCTLWSLVAGQPPFGDLRGQALRSAHLSADRPPLLPIVAVPSGLEGVLRRMIAPAPESRYSRAAEVQAELRRLGRTDRPGVMAHGVRGEDSRPERTPLPARTTSPLEWVRGTLPSGPRSAPVPIVAPAEPPPEPDRAARALRGAGIGLYGLRPLPLVGRADERSAAWDVLVGAHHGDGPRVLVLRGPTGTGKSRLSAWIGEQAHAVLGAEVWTARHGPTDGGIGTLVGSWLGVSGPEVDEVLPHALASLPPGDPLDPVALRELVAPSGRIRFTAPDQRHAIVGGLVRRVARERLVVVRLEDAQWGADALGLARRLADDGPKRLLVVVTVREEVLAERAIEQPLLRQLAAHPRTTVVQVPPVPRRDRLRLAQELLPLEPSLGARIAERGAGNPLFMVQLVGQLVARGVLEADDAGFRLKGDPGPIADLAEVWSQRLEVLLEGAHGAVALALEFAAALGVHVDGEEWRAALELGEVPPPRRLAERLVESGLARADADPEQGFVFVHAMLRDVLLARSEASGRLQRIHAICAQMLASRAGPDVAERVGRHLLEAGRPREAAEQLRFGAAERVARGEHDAAEALLEVWEAAMTQAAASPRDAEWGRGWLVRHERAYLRGDFEAADTWAERVADHARWHGWPELECRALLARGSVLVARGEGEAAAALVGRAAAMPTAGDPALAPWVRLTEGVVLASAGDHLAAGEAFAAAEERFAAMGEPLEAAGAARFRAMAALRLGDLEVAQDAAERARAGFLAAGQPAGLAQAENTLGEVYRARGDLAAAETWYRAAREGMRRLGIDRVVVPSANLGIVLLDLGRVREARELLESVAATVGCRSRPPLLAAVRALVVAAAAEEQDWASFDGVLEAARAAVRAGGRDGDTATALDRAEAAARRAGELARAEAIASLRG